MSKESLCCPKCDRYTKLTKHHWLPVRHFGRTNNYILLCRDCHDEIEQITPYERISYDEYWGIVEMFLSEDYG